MERLPFSERSGSGRGVGRVVRRRAAVRADGAAVGHELAGVFEHDHAVAEEAPSLFGEGGDNASRVMIAGVGRRTGRLVLAHRAGHGLSDLRGWNLWIFGWCTPGGAVVLVTELLKPLKTAVSMITASCELTHMTKNARYSAERRIFEQVTLNAIQIRPFG
jgi:hypothetical protein